MDQENHMFQEKGEEGYFCADVTQPALLIAFGVGLSDMWGRDPCCGPSRLL